MSASSVSFLAMHEVAGLLRRGELSAVALAQQQLARIERLEPVLKSFACVTADLALKQAEAADAAFQRGEIRSPLQGIPVGIKDLCRMRGAPTAGGTVVFRSLPSTEDAVVVRRLKQSGAVVLGKLQMTEAGFSDYHPSIAVPMNPWGAKLWSGVSSSGSGVATAAGLCYAAVSTDTGGSIRWPSAANGVTGLKPTWERLSTKGVLPCAPSLDTVGPMARNALDCALLMQAMMSDDVAEQSIFSAESIVSHAPNLQGLRIGVDEHYAFDKSDEPTRAHVSQAIKEFEALGAQVRHVRVPDYPELLADMLKAVAVEAAVSHAATFPSRAAEYGPRAAEVLASAHLIGPEEHSAITARRKRFCELMKLLFNEIDLLVTPVQCFAAPDATLLERQNEGYERLERLARFTCAFNLTGQPTLTLPCGFTEMGAPIGFQLVARSMDDALLLQLGYRYQSITEWHLQVPPL